MRLSDLVCAKPVVREDGSAVFGLPRPTNETYLATLRALPRPPGVVPVLRSRPSATAAIYLDFDGETVNDGAWSGSTIVAPAARLNDSQIYEVWQRVSQDFNSFDVNVTTSLADYNNAPVNTRTHCIITENDAAAPGSGGVAYIGSFNGSSSWICWAFLDTDAKPCAEVISHEVGHTLGLLHDGRTSPAEEYYGGHGSGETGWAPIMGVGYYQNLVQWSRGEYLNANRTENDLSIMDVYVDFIADDHGNTTGTASAIVGDAATGVIERNTDFDVFSVSLTAGTYTIYLQPNAYGNLDALLEVINGSGVVVTSANPVLQLAASADLVLASDQTVYFRVSGVGKTPVLGDGYSNYGCLGGYTLFGFGNQEQPPSAPNGLFIRRISGSRLEVNWQASLGADGYLLYRDGNLIITTTATVWVDTGLTPATLYAYQVSASNEFGTSALSTAVEITTPGADEFIMDGQPDFGGYLLSNPGMVIYAAVRSNRFYVSTWSPGNFGVGFGSDHHILVSDVLLNTATTPAPWAKAGFLAIPGNKPFLAGEESSDYAGWFNTTGDANLFKWPNNTRQLEGSFDMVAEFGAVPETIYVAAIAYGTTDGGGVNAQAPAATTANNNLEPTEFLAIPVSQIRDSGLYGVYDILSPASGFAIRSYDKTNQFKMGWLTVPGATIRLYRQTNRVEDILWQQLSSQTATAGQWGMSYTDTNAPVGAAFYRLGNP